jgi:hypothetical protein
MSSNYTKSCYAGCEIVLTTKHNKIHAIAPPFGANLGALVVENVMDTDLLGTFSGEVLRQGSALDCARQKCEWSLNNLNSKFEYGLSSEGSFGPHPYFPFIPCDSEILYFIDLKRNFQLHMSHISEKTNYFMKVVTTYDEILAIANKVLFPSHALILKPNQPNSRNPIFKGLDTEASLQEAFNECLKYTQDGKVWLETDMRAHVNPSRMAVIQELAEVFSKRLATCCPACQTPGWGVVNHIKGLPCSACGMQTTLTQLEAFGCVTCDYQEQLARADGKKFADPGNCNYCNP